MSNSGQGSSRRSTRYPPPGRHRSPSPPAPHPARPVTHSLTSRAAVRIPRAASGPGQPKGRRGPGEGGAFATAAPSPQPSPIALGRRRRPRVAGARGAAAARRGSGCGDRGAAKGPGPHRAQGRPSSACRRLRRAAGPGENKGARRGRPAAERGAVCAEKRLPADGDGADPPPRGYGARSRCGEGRRTHGDRPASSGLPRRM